MYNAIKGCRLSTPDSNLYDRSRRNASLKGTIYLSKDNILAELSDMTVYLNFCCIEFMIPEKIGGFVFPLDAEDIRLSRICADKPFEL